MVEAKYGVQQVEACTLRQGEHQKDREIVPWTTPGLKVNRLRLLSDPGYHLWDVSYCYGTLNGQDVRVDLPFHNLPKHLLRRTIVGWAIRDGVNAKQMGILDNISTLC